MGLGKKKILSQGASGVVAADNFQTITYTGNCNTQSTNSLLNQSGTLNFQPDLIWFKNRTGAYLHQIYDSIRGANKLLNPGVATTIGTYTGYAPERDDTGGDLTNFNASGFTIGTCHFGSVNEVGFNNVAWCWKGGGAASSNTNGTITSQVSANQAAGFSIASYTGNSTQNATIGHGLTSPKLTIVKNRGQADAWFVGSTLLGTNQFLELNTTAAKATNSDLNYEITSTAFKTTSSSPHDMINQSGENYIMYTFADVAGYQKIGSYSSDGNNKTINVGFQPRWVLIKNHSSAGNYWVVLDSLRTTGTNGKNRLYANSAYQEDTSIDVSFNATDFTLLTSNADVNGSGKSYIYLAIA